MWKRFSILSIVALVGIASLLPMQVMRGEFLGEAKGEGAGAEQVAIDGKASGEVLLDLAIAEMESHEALSARTTVQVHLFGHHLFARRGSYVQKGSGENRKYRFEIAVQGGAGPLVQTQVNDSLRLWILEDNVATKKLRLVDLVQLREAGGLDAMKTSSPQLDMIGMGGLSGVMRSIQNSFRFEQAVQIEWNGQAVWAMRGPWRPEQLARLMSMSGKNRKKPDIDKLLAKHLASS